MTTQYTTTPALEHYRTALKKCIELDCQALPGVENGMDEGQIWDVKLNLAMVHARGDNPELEAALMEFIKAHYELRKERLQ